MRIPRGPKKNPFLKKQYFVEKNYVNISLTLFEPVGGGGRFTPPPVQIGLRRNIDIVFLKPSAFPNLSLRGS